ncbi:MAG: hypothetical protein Q9162_007191 [Coniocarpon cinnabarinum]
MAPSTSHRFDHPRWSRHDDAIRSSYDLPHRVYCAQLYPVRASNGSHIIVYGHDAGLTLLWRGGRRLRAHKNNQRQPRVTHQTRSTDVITIDSDEDTAPAKQAFEEEEDEQDPAQPFESIIATHDIELKGAVYDVAVPPLPAEPAQHSTVPDLFNDQIVIAAACSDNGVDLVVLPLDPSSPHRKTKAHGRKKHHNDVQRVEVTAADVHDGVPRGVAFSYTNVNSSATYDASDEDTKMQDANAQHEPSNAVWQLLIASHSCGAFGLLVVSRLQFAAGQDDLSASNWSCSTEVVKLQAKPVRVSFNPGRYPARRHSRLLLTDDSGAVRLFETTSRDRDAETRLLTTFFAPYAPNSGVIGSRVKLLDASWALYGKCIMILLGDGRWGIWDYTGAGPQVTNRNAASGPRAVPGTGSTQLTIEGKLALASDNEIDSFAMESRSLRKASASRTTTLAPMTPKTRKTRQESLFAGQSGGLKSMHTVTGKISLSPLSNNDMLEESVIISYGQDFFTIPRLFTSWKRTQDGAKANAAASGQATLRATPLQRVDSLSTLGEMVTSIAQFPSDSQAPSQSLARNVLVSAERRLVIWCPFKQQPKPSEQLGNLFTRPPQPSEQDLAIQRSDRDQLHRGNLSLAGVDRMLASMGSGQAAYT